MVETDRFKGKIGATVQESTPHWPEGPKRPPGLDKKGAPNILVVLFDDVGFSDFGCYGSPIKTPTIDRLAAQGLRYTGFHTTAMCSTTRAALLTGRNHHSVGVGCLANFDSGFPGYRGKIAKEAGTLADHPALIHLTMTAWSKVFRRDFLAGLGVSFGSAGPAPHEDVPVTTLALLTAGRIGVLDRVCYRYRRSRRGSYLAAVSDANFNIFGSYEQVFNYLAERTELRAPVTPAVYAAVFERAIWHYTTLIPLVPRRRRREFFHRMSADFRRWRPDGFRFPPGPRGVKFRLAARDAYWAYALLDPVNRLRVGLRSNT